MQQGMLFHTLYNPQANLYFEQTALTIRGELDGEAFAAAWAEVLARHPILRTAFYWEEMDKPLQVVHRHPQLAWQEEDWRGLAPDKAASALDAFLLADQRAGFPLDQPPLMRFALLRFADDGYYFVWSHHHLLLDGWSVPLLLDEVFSFYGALGKAGQDAEARRRAQEEIRRRRRPRPYREYILWLQQQDGAAAERYWRGLVADISAPTPFSVLEPARRSKPAGPKARATQHFAEQRFNLSPEITGRLQALARQQRLTLNTLVQGAWSILLSRYSREERVVFGATVSGRPPELPGAEGMVGLFINTLPVCVHAPGDALLLPWLREILEAQVKREQFAHTPLVDIQGWSDLPPGSALFESILVFENYPMDGALSTQGIDISDIRTFEHTNYPLTVEALAGQPGQAQAERTLSLKLKYDAARFDAFAIENMGRHLLTLLSAMAENPERRLAELPLLDANERAGMLNRWQAVDAYRFSASQGPTDGAEPTADLPLHLLFEAQVARRPDAVAVVCDGEQLTYAELNRRANRLAHHLQSLGVGPEVLVGLCLERSLEMVVAVLAILKAGGAYLPLDTAYPQERLDFMLADAQAPVLLTQASLADKFSGYGGHRFLLDVNWPQLAGSSQENPVGGADHNHLAYVIYTSGSTGAPKGVMISHANVTRLFAATDAWYSFGGDDVWTLFHSIAFDFSVWELWGALLYGGRLVVVPYLVSRSPEAFYRLLVDEQVTVLNQTPSAFRQLMGVEASLEATLPDRIALRLVIFGGEALEIAGLRPWFQRHGDQKPRLVNMYGITETTVHVTYRPLGWADIDSPGSVIGGPIPDLQLYILDENREPTPVGVPGEMYVGGAGVSRGYLNRPELNRERFIPHPFQASDFQAEDARLYRTGDLARFLPNGDIEYLGRIDHQVKIRGFRIELGEIEHALAQHPAVQEQIVLVREDEPGHKRLVAYLVFKHGQADALPQIRDYLQQKLPEYMVPAAFVVLSALPLTPNGKTDRRALPAPDSGGGVAAVDRIAPRTPEEKALAAIWSAVLGRAPIGIYDSFFDLGGDSILSIQVLAKAKEQKLNLSLEQLFTYPTIYELAQRISPEPIPLPPSAPFSLLSQADRSQLAAEMGESIEDAYPLTRLQLGMLFHSDYTGAASANLYGGEEAQYHNVNSLHLAAPFDEGSFRRALDGLMAGHPVLRTAFAIDGFSRPLQLVYRSVPTPLTVEDLRHLSPGEQEEALRVWFEQQTRALFAWDQPPLLRFHIHQRDAHSFQLSWAEHHAIVDGWSVASMITELLQRYLAERSGIPFGGQPVESSFREYVALEGATVASPQARDYWAGQLAGAEMARLPRLPHAYRSEPTSHGEPTGARAGEYDVAIGPEVSQGLKALARQAGAPLKNVLLAAHLRVLSLLCGQEDVVTGLAWNGRLEERDGERVVGLFLNTLPFRLKMEGGNWLELVQESFAGERAAIGFRRYPYAELQKTFGPLFETAFNFTHFHIYEAVADAPGMKIVDGRFFQRTNFTLLADFSLDIADGRVLLSLGYDARQLDPEQIQAIGGYYARTLAEMAAHPQGQYQEFSPLSAQERAQQLVEWNDTATDYPRTATIHRLFEEQAAHTPEAVAVVLAGAGSATGREPSLRYRELNERANQVARALLAQGAGPETLVGICVERSLEMVVGLLGILKAGAAFVPLDPAYPAERLHFMIEDTEVGILLTQERFLDQLPATATTLCLDGADPGLAGQPTANPQSGAGADSLAYVMYTSGSTGKPKGVCVTHRNVTRLVQNTNFAVLDREQVFLQLAPISFDASTLEIWGALLNGARLVVAPPATPSLEELGQILQSYGVTILWLTSGLFHLMVDERLDDLRGVKQLLAGGDVLSVPHVQKVLEALPDCTLINGYGPTENTTFTCCYPVREMRGFDMSVPIGRPIANTQVYIVNERMQPVPVGVAGELYAGGDGVARGYHARPELSSERFLPNPFGGEAGGTLYKTGDLARYLPDGAIEFLGRLDNQVKVRGFRVELGEIESVLGQLPEVRDVVAIVREDQPGSKRIVAYLTARPPHGDDLSPERLRGFLHDRLPDFMIPGAFVTLDALPLNPNGKVDRRALPAPDWRASRPEDDYTAPRTETEERLARIWAGVLNLERVGIHDNYFALGGDSILSIQIVSRARQAGMQFSARQLFENQTVAELAAVAHSLADSALAEQGPVVGDLPLTPIQRWFFEQEQPAPHHFNQAALFETPGDVSPALLEECVGRLLAHHDALRLRFAPQPDPSDPSDPGWRQTIVPPDDTIPFQVIDLSHLPAEAQPAALAEEAARLQAGLNLVDGPILRVALFTLGAARPARLLILVHHLAIDGISWRILGEDLESAYEQLGRGQAVQLPPKTTSFRAWAQRLHQAGGPLVMDEAPYWAAMAERRQPALPVDRAAPENRVADTAQLRVSLSAAETDALLHEAPEAYNTQINDLLLTALAQTLAPWTQSDSLYINLEGHGREELFADVDLSRTVGWFTTIFPVWLTPEQDGPGAAIKSVKEQLRQVPRRGIGYGILRYLAQGESSLPAHLSSLTPAISFNYLGQFQAPAQGALLQRLGQEESGPLYSPQGMRPHLLDIVGAVIDGQLQMEWIYNKTIHTESTIGELAHAFKRALSALIAHCQSPQAGGWTPSDFPDAELDQDELEALLSALA